MTDRNLQEESQDAGQNQDPLAELEAKEPALHRAEHHGARRSAVESDAQSAEPPTARDVDTVRGHGNSQSVRHAD